MRGVEQKPPTFIKVFGGLGNQLFQYAYGQRQKSEGFEPRYIVDARARELTDIFDVPQAEVLESGNRLVLAAWKAYARFVVRNFAAGFFQDRVPDVSVREGLVFRRAEAYRRNALFGQIAESEAVAVHVRGGDYLTPSAFHGWGDVCDAAYYERAVALLDKAVEAPRYFLFTNDEDFALSMLPAKVRSRMTSVHGAFEKDPGFHLYLMQACRHNIIANSTFSWWGAFLGKTEGRVVVAPTKWDLFACPPEWLRI